MSTSLATQPGTGKPLQPSRGRLGNPVASQFTQLTVVTRGKVWVRLTLKKEESIYIYIYI